MADLSIVLISKNQAWNIARLLESVLAETEEILSREVVLVDSASTDRTIEIACNYPVKIISLQPDQRLTAAAGRYIGYKHTSGNFVLFLDGDMELYPGWLARALAFIQSQKKVAAVTGHLIDLPKAAKNKPEWGPSSANDFAKEVLHGGGAAIYRRSTLEQVGTFNPYLYSDEEPELCIRIRHAGYRVLALESPIAYHYSDQVEALSTLAARRRRNLYLGEGQNLRHHLGSELLWLYFKERGYALAPAVGIGSGLISLAYALLTHQWRWFGVWLLLLSAIIAGDSYRKRSFYGTLSSLLKRLFIVEGTVRGFLSKPLDPDNTPLKFEVVK